MSSPQQNLIIELVKKRCPLNFILLSENESARQLTDWKVQLFPYWLKTRFNQCVNLLLSKNGCLDRTPVYARNTTIFPISDKLAHSFYNSFHIQGYGQGKHFGLVYNDSLISLMSFKYGASNTINRNTIELNRYATDPNYFVVGGYDKLIKFAVQQLQCNKIVSYADLMVSQGSLYSHKGWKLISKVSPDYHYIYKDVLTHKFNFRIKRFKEDPNLIYKSGLSESQLAKLNNIPRVYDCGKLS